MNKNKATFVTAVMTAMLMAILAFLLLLDVKFAFFGITGIFALMGIVWADALLLGWLSDKEEKDLQPVEVVHADGVGEDYEATYDEIKHEIERELGGDEV